MLVLSRVSRVLSGTSSKLLSVLLLLLLPLAGLAAEDFALLDQHGRFHQLSRYFESEAVVLFVYQDADPVSRASLPALHELQEQYATAGIHFMLLNPADSRAAVQQEAALRSITLPMLLDEAQLVARSLDAVYSGEVIVLAPDNFEVLYRGSLAPADLDAPVVQHMRQVLDAILADSEVPVGSEVSGMPIVYRGPLAADAPPISYQNDIVPLLRRNCTGCHVEDGLAPWAMSSYIMVLGWSPMIRETIITRRMPPGQIDMHVGQWRDPPHISIDDQALLLAWIDAGAPRDGELDPLADPVAAAPAWPLGEPDLVVEVPGQAVPATGTVDFILARAELDLERDQWISAVAYEPGDRSVLHSLMVYARDENAATEAPAALLDSNSEFISLYVPGEQADVFADDSGFLLRSDKDLAFKIRYITSGRETFDATRIGLYFRDEAPRFSLQSLVLSNEQISIPAGVADHRETASVTVTEDAWIDMFSAHAHGRATSMTIDARRPGAAAEQLINIASYNFNWQMAYRPQTRIAVEAGTQLVSETVYDNSAANPYNPDPAQAAAWGISDAAEMFSHYIRIARPVQP